ncbi:hypothetical protein KAR91_29230 [Candidatus Pacearchaeota archaeon]|nr:hypothetical protein [Candidatus Pacearchaeota archaeon]
MGRLDQQFANTANTWVFSRRGFPRYRKRFNSQGTRKQARTHTIGSPSGGLTRANSTRIRAGKHRVD